MIFLYSSLDTLETTTTASPFVPPSVNSNPNLVVWNMASYSSSLGGYTGRFFFVVVFFFCCCTRCCFFPFFAVVCLRVVVVTFEELFLDGGEHDDDDDDDDDAVPDEFES